MALSSNTTYKITFPSPKITDTIHYTALLFEYFSVINSFLTFFLQKQDLLHIEIVTWIITKIQSADCVKKHGDLSKYKLFIHDLYSTFFEHWNIRDKQKTEYVIKIGHRFLGSFIWYLDISTIKHDKKFFSYVKYIIEIEQN